MIDEAIREFVRLRAGDRCEYCRLPQHAVDGRFHVEHIVAQQHRQDDGPANLAWACARCNSHKGTNLASVDPATDVMVQIFHPRTDNWIEHFAFRGPEIRGLTATGRATVRLLQMNARHRVELRSSLMAAGIFD
ncbi:MAG: HNH endonuclease [Planctomycetota bacterium]|nr:HNH endonuclease [Planctomycetota bacterium]